jgi:hypothetical protein
MSRLEDLTPNTSNRGILPNGLVTVVNVQWHGSAALELTYKTPEGKVANELLYRHDEPRIEVVEQGRPWSFDGDGALFRLVSEAQRIRLASVEISFFGTECGVFAYSGSSWAITARDDIHKAKEAALSDCHRRGKACQIVASVCADGAARFSAAD